MELLFEMDGRDARAFMIVCRGIESLDRALRLWAVNEALGRKDRKGAAGAGPSRGDTAAALVSEDGGVESLAWTELFPWEGSMVWA